MPLKQGTLQKLGRDILDAFEANGMTSEVANEFDAEYDDLRKIRRAAAAAIKKLSLFRSAGRFTQHALDQEVARIAQEKLQPHGCDLVVHRMDDGLTRFLIKIQNTGRRYDLIKNFSIATINRFQKSEYDA
jgi:hypothetical protein